MNYAIGREGITRRGVMLILALITVVMVGRGVPSVVTASFVLGSEITSAEQATAYVKNNLGFNDEAMLIKEDTIRIPSEFDGIYEDYNKLQKSIGYDLERYMGKKADRYVFEAFGDLRITILVYNDKIIGGDISESQLGGIISPLTFYNPPS